MLFYSMLTAEQHFEISLSAPKCQAASGPIAFSFARSPLTMPRTPPRAPHDRLREGTPDRRTKTPAAACFYVPGRTARASPYVLP